MQPYYIDEQKKTVSICKDFAERVWSGAANNLKSLSYKQTTYDNCGLNVNDNIKIQSIAYKSYVEFFNDVKPPFFSDY